MDVASSNLVARSMLTKTRTVASVLGGSVDSVVFGEQIEKRGDSNRNNLFIIDRDVWEDFGEPMSVTITIEPGDLLNDKVSSSGEVSVVSVFDY